MSEDDYSSLWPIPGLGPVSAHTLGSENLSHQLLLRSQSQGGMKQSYGAIVALEYVGSEYAPRYLPCLDGQSYVGSSGQVPNASQRQSTTGSSSRRGAEVQAQSTYAKNAPINHKRLVLPWASNGQGLSQDTTPSLPSTQAPISWPSFQDSRDPPLNESSFHAARPSAQRRPFPSRPTIANGRQVPRASNNLSYGRGPRPTSNSWTQSVANDDANVNVPVPSLVVEKIPLGIPRTSSMRKIEEKSRNKLRDAFKQLLDLLAAPVRKFKPAVPDRPTRVETLEYACQYIK